MKISILLGCLLLSMNAMAQTKKPFRLLMIGNSFTFFPSAGPQAEPDSHTPYLPKIMKQIIESKHPELEVQADANAQNGFTFEDHDKEADSRALFEKTYDAFVLQPYSIEPLKLPRWFRENGVSSNENFMKFGEKIIRESGTPAQQIILSSNWAYHPKHPYYQSDFPGLRGESGSSPFWFGTSWEDETFEIEKSVRALAKQMGTQWAPIGRAWLDVKKNPGPVSHDQLYWDLTEDFKHPAYAGSYLAACVLFRTLFKESAVGAAHEARLSDAEALDLQKRADQIVEQVSGTP